MIKIALHDEPAQTRVPGSMEGEIRIAADFDQLPDDMAEAFGMLDAGKCATPTRTSVLSPSCCE